MASLKAPDLQLQPVSVTRRMAASLPGLRAKARQKGLQIHHLGAGYPHPEVTDPRGFLAHQARYFEHLSATEGVNDPEQLPEHLRESFSYVDTLGPARTRELFASVYGRDWGLAVDPEKLIPTVGATGGISLCCSVFERPGKPLAYITDAPTYAGFLTRAALNQKTAIYSVELDAEGPIVERLRAQVLAARSAGYLVPFYYTVPDGHNPAGFSFSSRRRAAVLEVARELDLLILEDAPYLYISFADPTDRALPFFALAPEQTIHLFTGSKIGFPGPRIGFAYTEAVVEIHAGERVPLADLLLGEASAAMLFQNPHALRSFEALLLDQNFEEIESLWSVAENKLAVYRENRSILLDTLDTRLGGHRQRFSWTVPEGGFFTVFTFLDPSISTDEAFIEALVGDHGVVAIPLAEFYPDDARGRDPRAGLNQLRLSFCFSEGRGEARRRELAAAANAFCDAVLAL